MVLGSTPSVVKDYNVLMTPSYTGYYIIYYIPASTLKLAENNLKSIYEIFVGSTVLYLIKKLRYFMQIT